MLKWAGGMKLDNEQLRREIKEKIDQVRADSTLNEREKRNRIIMLATKLGEALWDRTGAGFQNDKKQD
jgi:formyltetrahydrofolate hydrolase